MKAAIPPGLRLIIAGPEGACPSGNKGIISHPRQPLIYSPSSWIHLTRTVRSPGSHNVRLPGLVFSHDTVFSVFAPGSTLHSFLGRNGIPYATDRPPSVYQAPLVDGHLGFPHLSATTNNVSTDIRVEVFAPSRGLDSLESTPGRGIAGQWGDSMFDFLRNWMTVFHGGCTTLRLPPAMCEGGRAFLNCNCSSP